ncbi:MAG TPA: signal peptidase II [Candidatus Uhrbacteria bacterium]|nr:signal peptidase II [Candidatus Uhrbacteria bacterium]
MNGDNFCQKLLLIIFFSFSLFGAESVIKYYFINKIPSEGFYLLGNYLQLVFSPNENMAFGLAMPQFIIIILIIIILIFLSYLWWLSLIKASLAHVLAVSLIILGALSNLIDRLIFGYVIDYINVFIWPVFNLADCLIVAGVLLYIISEIKIEFFKK